MAAYFRLVNNFSFSIFARVNSRGVPACANLWLGLLSAVCALFFPLEVLVEMMSIGTLLAYTLVNSCVLILRYQPDRSQSHFMDLFEKQLPEDNPHSSKEQSDLLESRNLAASADVASPVGLWPVARAMIHGQHPAQQTQECTKEGGRLVINAFLSLSAVIIVFDVVLVVAEESVSSAGTLSLLFVAVLCILCHVIAMSHFPQVR